MKFNIKSKTLFARISKRLRECLSAQGTSVPDTFNFKDATSYVLAEVDYRTWSANVGLSDFPESSWDEECTASELRDRREREARRLTEYSLKHDVQLERVDELIANWQPTAARPQSPALDVDKINELRNAGVPLQAFFLLLMYELVGELPTEDDLELFRCAIKASIGPTNKALPLYIGPLAIRLVNQKTGPRAKLGVALLEMLSETPLHYVKVNLARALRNGWGAEQNLVRAKSLCKFVAKALDAGDDVFLEDESRVDFYTLQGQLYAESDLHGERLFAFKSYHDAAKYGSGPAALITSHYYLPLKPGMAQDEFSGVIPPDMAMAAHYFEIAVERGFDPVTKKFSQDAF